MSFRSALILASLFLLGEQTASIAKPLVCPTSPTAATSIPAGDLAAIGKLDASPDGTARLNRLVTILQDRGMNPANVVNDLISAYCPVVAANATLSDQQKTATVRQFASQVARAVYAPDAAQEIILDVALSPDVANAVNDKAKADKISPQEWAAKAIAGYLKAAR